jgi:hypothetical protein
MVNPDRRVSRRAFLGSTLSYLALAVGVTNVGDLVARLIADEAPPEFSPNPWISIDRHGAVTLRPTSPRWDRRAHRVAGNRRRGARRRLGASRFVM